MVAEEAVPSVEEDFAGGSSSQEGWDSRALSCLHRFIHYVAITKKRIRRGKSIFRQKWQ